MRHHFLHFKIYVLYLRACSAHRHQEMNPGALKEQPVPPPHLLEQGLTLDVKLVNQLD